VQETLNWIHQYPKAATALLGALVSTVIGLVPLRYHSSHWYSAVLRFLGRLSVLTPPETPGTFKMPLARVAPQKVLVRHVLPILLCLAIAGCATTPAAIAYPTWVQGCSTAIAGTRNVIARIRTLVPTWGLDGEQIANLDQDLDAAGARLDAAANDIAAYSALRSMPSQCALHADLESAFGILLRVTAFLRLLDVPVPDIVDVVIGVLGAVSDAVAPGCNLAGETAVARALSRDRSTP
jgi:hypothetical protein